jgi:hypothetical protein
LKSIQRKHTKGMAKTHAELENMALQQFNEASFYPWFDLTPWEPLNKVATTYCQSIDLSINPDKALVEEIKKHENGTPLPFIQYVETLKNIIKNHSDNITPCILSFAAICNFKWLSQKRETPLHPIHVRIITGHLIHCVHGQLQFQSFLPELTINWGMPPSEAAKGWFHRKDNAWWLTSHTGKSTLATPGFETSPAKMQTAEPLKLKDMPLKDAVCQFQETLYLA